MRHALLAWLGLVIVIVVSSVDCSITHKSDGFACTSNSQCSQGRSCVSGFCVVGDGTTDAGITDGKGSNHPDASDCPSNCTSCDDLSHTCFIDCAKTSCNGQISCPLGWNCTIDCSTADSCRSGVSCTQGASCNITCSGDTSCRNIACGAGPCDVQCIGNNSCRTVGCGASCRCDVVCGLNASCEGVTCKVGCKDALDPGCSSANAQFCDTCP